ncbi:MAG: DUF4374 domain-containing protein [Bacteroidales bacterium]
MKKSRINIVIVSILTGLISFACEKEDNNPDTDSGSNYVVHLRVGSSGETADYILTTDEIMSGSISSEGKGIEQIGWRYSASTSKTLLSIGYYDDNNAIGYGIDANGQLYEKGKFAFETTLDQFSHEIANGKLVAIEVPRTGFANRVFYSIDGDNVKVLTKKFTPIYENMSDSLVAWPTAIIHRDDKIFVPFYTLHANGTFATPSTDTAFVAVYSYPEFEFDQYIKDTRMGPIGIYGNTNGMVKTETGDLYAYSSASLACGFTTQQKKSGVLRVNNNEMSFDAGYFFDVESQTGGHKLVYFEYVGNGLVVARLITDDSGLWSYYGSADVCKLVVMDLVNETITDIDDVPLHRGQYAPMLVENGKVYVNITTANDAHIYEIDPVTAKATKGAEIKGKEIQSLVRLANE